MTMHDFRIAALAGIIAAALAAPAFAQGAYGTAPAPASSAASSQDMTQSPEQMAPAPVVVPPPSAAQRAPTPPPAAYNPVSYTAPQAALSPHPNAPLQPKQEGDVVYITGGIGDNEVDQLKSESNKYNFQMINSDPTGHYTADTNLVISSKDGREVIRIDNAGPLFYAQLPVGEYTVEAINGAQHETRTVRISAKGHTEMHLVWK